MYVRIQYAFYMKTILAIKRAHAFEHTHTIEHTTRTHTQTQASMYVCMSRNCVLCFVHARKRDNMTGQQPQ